MQSTFPSAAETKNQTVPLVRRLLERVGAQTPSAARELSICSEIAFVHPTG